MDKSQKNYLLKRVDGIVDDKVFAIRDEEKVHIGRTRQTGLQRMTDISIGCYSTDYARDFKTAVDNTGIKLVGVKRIESAVKELLGSDGYPDRKFVRSLISNHKKLDDTVKKMQLARITRATKRIQKVINESTRIKDKIILGDEKEALKALQDFTKLAI